MANYIREQEKEDIRIVDIYWDRIYLHIKLEGARLEERIYVIASNENKYLYYVDFDKETREIVVNITNIYNQKMLGNGKWYLKYLNENYAEEKEIYNVEREAYQIEKEIEGMHPEKPWSPFKWKNIPATLDTCYKLESMDKVYRFSGNSYAYVFSFETEKKRDELICAIEATYMVKMKKARKRYFKVEATRKSAMLKRHIVYLLQKGLNKFYRACAKITPKNGTRILLMSETRSMGGNLKALDDRLKERGLDKQFKISYYFEKTPDMSRKKVFFYWFKLALVAARQDYIFVDDYVPFFDYVNPDPRTTLTQVWHAGIGYKTVGYARFGKKGSPRPFDSCHRKYDYAIVGGKALQEVYAEVFGINKENCLPFGLMRNDGYMDETKIEAFKTYFYEEHPEFYGKKIIMFAPTFRGTGQKQAHYPSNILEQDKIYQMCGDQYIFMIKMHPFIRKRIQINEDYQDRIVDYSDYPDINELFYVTDILITDYSSNIYEFSMHKRPIISFAPDKDEYELIRSVHRPLDKYAPGKVCTTLDEVISTIQNQDFEMDRLYKFVEDNIDETNGCAADKVIDFLLLHKTQTKLFPDED